MATKPWEALGTDASHHFDFFNHWSKPKKQMNVARGTARAARRRSTPMAKPSIAAQAQMLVDHAHLMAKLGRALFMSHGKAALPV